MLIEQGGWVLVAIFMLSVFAWVLIVHKCLCLYKETKGGIDWVDSAVDSYRRGEVETVKTLCLNHPGTLGRMLLAAIEIRKSRQFFTHKHRKAIIKHEKILLHKDLNLIAAAGAVLPLLGLLGTVLGMAKTFNALKLCISVEASGLTAKGVSEALITTQAGLVTALPIILIYGFLLSYIRKKYG